MNSRRFYLPLLLLVGGAPGARAAPAEPVLLVRNAPPDGLVMGRLTLPSAWCGPRAGPAGSVALTAVATVNARPVGLQFVPLGGRDYLVLAKLPAGGTHRVRLKLIRGRADAAPRAKVTVKTPWLAVTHDRTRGAGLPARIEFLQTRKVFQNFNWNDRVHHKQLGGYLLRHDRHAELAVVSSGPICTAVRTAARYLKADSTAPKSAPRAKYLWLYFRDVPLVFVRAEVRQKTATAWNELHFLELNFPDKSFPTWAGGEPLKKGGFSGSQKGLSFGGWGMLLDGRNGIAALRGGKILLYDGRGGYGTYLHPHASRAWAGWRDKEAAFAGWLWIGTDGDCIARVRASAGRLPTSAHLIATRPKLRDGIEAARKEIDRMPAGDPRRPQRLYHVAMAEKLEAQGNWDLADQVLAGRVPDKWATVIAGDLALTLEPVKDGVRCGGLFDLARGRELLSAAAAPLLTCTLRHSRSRKEIQLRADAGWGELDMRKDKTALTIRWAKPTLGVDLSGLRVTAVATPDAAKSRISWKLRIDLGGDTPWSVWRVRFPQVSLGPFARRVDALFPRGSGEVATDIGGRSWRLRGTYPSGWTPMQFLAAYDADSATGLYVACHDAQAHVKDILAETRADPHALRLSFDHPAPDMGVAGNGFVLSGQAVWQILRGDWFDAARIYRDWVRKEAEWMPRPVDRGRVDSPAWMRELCIWGMLSGDPKRALAQGRKFEQFMGLATAFHWYNWHKIPFDNDYPHYFPARDGFKETVAELQKAGKNPVFVMPYINGRLWDTRDKGAADFQFTKLARPAATKDENGRVCTEMYGSKEADGSRVKLAAMCPSTALWRERVRQIVLRLMKENGTKAVYIDQIAAAAPRLCFDKSHGHPLGGGGWWVKAYGKMLAEIRKGMPAGHVLTTECNAEPYVKWFDGYLTWHWQYDGQVPAFGAVYGGAIQMFGRAYRGGPTKDLALRMKAGQQLVFGEQIGWISAQVVKERANAAFLRQMAWLRWRVRRYFDTGRMARPPKLIGTVPTVTADWQWSGVWPVTTDAVLTGAWEQPDRKRVALIFVNVSDKPVTARVSFDASSHGLGGGKVRRTRVTADGRGRTESAPARFTRKIVFAPQKAWAWEVTPEGG